jgi:hypothetical protein
MRLRAFATPLALICLNVVTACAATDTTVHWQPIKLGEFTLTVPASMVLKAGGTDSQAGTLQDASHQISYDYGAYSDPLKSVDGATAFKERAGLMDGLAARFVSFNQVGASGKTQACEGVHVPFIRKSVIGSIKLTLLLCGDAKTARATAEKIFASVKFQTDVSR